MEKKNRFLVRWFTSASNGLIGIIVVLIFGGGTGVYFFYTKIITPDRSDTEHIQSRGEFAIGNRGVTDDGKFAIGTG